MPWVRFIDDFDWQPLPKVVIAYKAGQVNLVRQICAEQAIRQGKAVSVERPSREDRCQQVS